MRALELGEKYFKPKFFPNFPPTFYKFSFWISFSHLQIDNLTRYYWNESRVLWLCVEDENPSHIELVSMVKNTP